MAMISNPVSEEQYRTDILTARQQMQAVLALPIVKGGIYLLVAVASIVFPKALFGFIFLLIWMWLSRDKAGFPGRVPSEAKRIDKSDPGPGGKGYRKSRGQVYFGWHRGTGKGGGKTEAIWAILCNFLCAGSGFTFIDGKGTQDGKTTPSLAQPQPSHERETEPA